MTTARQGTVQMANLALSPLLHDWRAAHNQDVLGMLVILAQHQHNLARRAVGLPDLPLPDNMDGLDRILDTFQTNHDLTGIEMFRIVTRHVLALAAVATDSPT